MNQPFSFFQSEVIPPATPLRKAITEAYRRAEPESVQLLLNQLVPFDHEPIKNLAKKLVKEVR